MIVTCMKFRSGFEHNKPSFVKQSQPAIIRERLREQGVWLMLGSSTATTSVFAYTRMTRLTMLCLLSWMTCHLECISTAIGRSQVQQPATSAVGLSMAVLSVWYVRACLPVSRPCRILRYSFKGTNQISAAWVSHGFSPACHQSGRFQRTLSQWPLRLDLPRLSITFGS